MEFGLRISVSRVFKVTISCFLGIKNWHDDTLNEKTGVSSSDYFFCHTSSSFKDLQEYLKSSLL